MSNFFVQMRNPCMQCEANDKVETHALLAELAMVHNVLFAV